jgi:two-component system, response regulator
MKIANRNKYILLIEDNPDDEHLTIRALRKGGIQNEIVVVRDGEQTLDFFNRRGRFLQFEHNHHPHVVLLDLNLPKISGLEVLAKIRENEKTKKLPVVILTSSREESDLTKGYQLGINSYVCKPVNIERFTEAIAQLGMYWIGLNETLNQR